MDVWNASSAYPNITCTINWIAIPLQHSVSQCHPIYSVIFLAKGKTPTEVGLSGKWTKTDWSICAHSRLVFDVSGNLSTNGSNVQIYGYNDSAAQKFWFYTADFGDVNMWVRTAQYSVSHDYIVDQGRSGIWFYRKWNSGLAEFWGGKQVRGNGTVRVLAVDFPFALTLLLYKSASAIYTSGSKGVHILSGDGASSNGLTDTGVYLVIQDVKDESTTTVASIEYNVKGLWK